MPVNCYRVAVLCGSFAPCAEQGLNGISLDLLLGGDPRVNDGGILLLLYCYVYAHVDLFTTIASGI